MFLFYFQNVCYLYCIEDGNIKTRKTLKIENKNKLLEFTAMEVEAIL